MCLQELIVFAEVPLDEGNLSQMREQIEESYRVASQNDLPQQWQGFHKPRENV